MKAAKLVASDPGVSALGWGPQHLPGEAIPMLALVSRAKTESSCAPLESPKSAPEEVEVLGYTSGALSQGNLRFYY